MGDMSEDRMSEENQTVLEPNLTIKLVAGMTASSAEAIINAGIDNKVIVPSRSEPSDEIEVFQLVHVNYRAFFVPLDKKYRADIRKGNSMDCRYEHLLNKSVARFNRQHIADHKKFEPDAEHCGIECFIMDCPAYIDCQGKD